MKNLKIPLLFAFRYLFSKKSVNAINIISIISIVGVFVSTAALVIVLSFYNGMEKFILSLNSTYSPDLRIEAKKGKSFSPDFQSLTALSTNKQVQDYTPVLEDKILVQYDGKQIVGKLKGINPHSIENGKQDILQSGSAILQQDSNSFALIGAQIQANLQVSTSDFFNNIDLYFPRRDVSLNNINPLEDFNIRQIAVQGILTYEPEFDNLIIVPIDFAKDILGQNKEISAVEVRLHNSEDYKKLQSQLQKELGEEYIVKNREQQNPTLYKTVKSEKLIVFFILTFIGIIAIFNIIGSLTMLVIDKKEDMKILQHLGASARNIENIFFIEGALIALIGSTFGIVAGYAFCKLQEMYGFIRTQGMEDSLLDSYPIDIRTADFVLVFLTVTILAFIVSYFASKLSVKEIGDITQISKGD